MRFSFELHFDPITQKRVRRIWDDLQDAGVCDCSRNGVAPHVTLAIAGPLDLHELLPRLRAFVQSTPRLEFRLELVEGFPGGVVYLAPAVTAELLDVHRRFHEEFDLPPAAISELNRQAQWRPHCTLGVAVEGRLDEAIERCRRVKLPIIGTFTHLKVVEWPAMSLRWKRALP